MTHSRSIILLFLAFTLLIACEVSEEEISIDGYSNEEFKLLSENLDIPIEPFNYSFGNLNLTDELNHKATMGRVLFYDNKLSADGTISCASCHKQSLAFSDDKAFSNGVHGNFTKRNSMALGSLRSFGIHYDDSNEERDAPGLFWDERANSIKDQLRQTIGNPNEMGIELNEIVTIVNNKNYYQLLNQKAFGTTKANEENVLDALEAFINSIGSLNTKFETEVIGNLNFITGDSVTGVFENKLGFDLFSKNCGSCHGAHLNFPIETGFSEDITVANNGLSIHNTDLDYGVYENTLKEEDKGKFKIPGLHNVELTAPYMHDGRFSTLEEVVDFYNDGIENNPNLHPALKDGKSAKRMNLSTNEKTALIDFLKSLTDKNITKDPKWSNPFR